MRHNGIPSLGVMNPHPPLEKTKQAIQLSVSHPPHIHWALCTHMHSVSAPTASIAPLQYSHCTLIQVYVLICTYQKMCAIVQWAKYGVAMFIKILELTALSHYGHKLLAITLSIFPYSSQNICSNGSHNTPFTYVLYMNKCVEKSPPFLTSPS